LLCSPYTSCRHFGLLFGERLDTLFTSSDKKISGFTRPQDIGFVADLFFSTLAPSTRYRIHCGYIFFSTLESGFIFFRIRCRIRRIRVDGSRTRKEKVADSKISGYMWTGPKMEAVQKLLKIFLDVLSAHRLWPFGPGKITHQQN